MASIVARNYAETLLALAQRNGGAPVVQAFLDASTELAGMLGDPKVKRFLETPRVPPAQKRQALRAERQRRMGGLGSPEKRPRGPRGPRGTHSLRNDTGAAISPCAGRRCS